MKTAPILFAAILSLFLPEDASAQGLFARFRGNGNEKVVTGPELANQESKASASFQKAQGYEQSGKLKQARDLYRSIVRNYPNTKVAAEAQFRNAQIRDQEGNGRKAYDEYKTLITKYRGSPHFQTAIERQFNIAERLRTSGKKGFLGLGAAIQPSELKKMYEQIADSAPRTQYAPRSLMAMGDIAAQQAQKPEAIGHYQMVVDNYLGTPYASDAQFEIYKLRGQTAERSNSPSEDRAQVDAGLDFVAQNPQDQRSEQVKAGLQQIEERSLEKMFNTGQFYEKSGKPDSALVYYREIVAKPHSKYYARASQRIQEIQRQKAGEEIEKKASRFGSLPALPKIERPKLRVGKKDDVVPIPTSESESTLPPPPSEPSPLVPNDPITQP